MGFQNRKSLVPNLTVILILLIGILGLIPGRAAYASTLIVTNTADSGAGSLRQTIADASPGDTITFDPSLAGQTIPLASTLTIDKDLIIDGTALNPPIQVSGDTNGDGQGDVALIDTSTGVTVALDGLTLTKGLAASDASIAAGVTNNGILTISNSSLSNNMGGRSGGVVNDGSLTLANSVLDGNTGIYAGGIFDDTNTQLTVTDSTFSNNQAVPFNGAGGGGGAITSLGAYSISGSKFIDNSAPQGGGAIGAASPASLNIDTSSFSNNSTADDGGAIDNFEGNLTISNSVFDGNSANHGGAISSGASDGSIPSTIILSNVTFNGNSAVNYGAAVTLYAGVQSTITGSVFENNTAPYAAGLSSAASLVLTNNTFSANVATGYNPSVGATGGGMINQGNLQMTNDTFSDNSGGAFINAGPAILRNSILANSIGEPDCTNGPGGVITENTNNLIETADGCSLPLITADPDLAPLADNGGPTWTMALLPGSPAIDAGDDSVCPATDQRGVARPQGPHCDIGAFEYIPAATPTATDTPTETPAFTPTFTSTATFTDTPTFTPTAIPSDTPTFTPTDTPTNTPTNTPTPTTIPTSVHIGNLDATSSWVGSKWIAVVTITVHDSNHNLVANAIVGGTWNNGNSDTVNCTTAANGQCSVTSTPLSAARTGITFTVKSVQAGSLVYVAADNHDPDGDSNGTQITVPQPLLSPLSR